MQDDQDRPSSETEATPKPPAGQNVKDLVTPGGGADAEAAAEEVAVPGGEMPGADDPQARPDAVETLDEERSEETDDHAPKDAFSGRHDD